jgi:hypothetical protein
LIAQALSGITLNIEHVGSTRVGYLPGVAYRYGRWADSVMVQRSLGPGTTMSPPRSVR